MNLLFVTVSFILGIYFYACSAEGYIIAGFVCIACMCLLWRKNQSLKNVLIFLTVAALAFGYAAFRDLVQNKNSVYFRGQTCKIEGRICDIAYSDEETDILTITTSKVTSGYLHLSGKHKVLLYVNHGDIAKYSYADIISVTAEISDYSSNMSDFDYALYYASKNINLSGFAKEEDIKILGNDIKWWRLQDTAYKIKTWANSVLEQYIQYPENQIVKGMVTGDKSHLPDEIYTNFRKSGIAHVIAVSGMHLGIILTVLMSFFGLFRIKRRVFSIIFYILAIWFFVIITGSPMSAVRSALMITLCFIATLLRRNETGLYSLALSMLIILLANPFALFDVGLGLSASATLALLLFTEPLNNILKNIMPLKLARILSASLAAQLGTIPICIMEFSSVSAVSVITNLLIYFVVTPIMWSAILLLAFSFFSPAAKFLGIAVSLLAKIITYSSQFLANLPVAVINVKKTDSFHILLYLTFACFIYFLVKKKTGAARLSGAGFSALMIIFILTRAFYSESSVTFLNTAGAGGALISAKNSAVLIDGGGSLYSYLPENAIIEQLENKGISRVNAFITKPDVSRCGAYPKLMEEGYIEKVFINRDSTGNFKKEITECAAKNNIEIVYTQDNQTLSFGDVIISADSVEGFNNYHMIFGEKQVLFAGGIPEEIIPRSYKCDILFMTDGCTSFKNCERFIMEASPLAVVTNDGKNNLNLDKLKFINPKTSGTACIYLNQNRITGLTLQRNV